MKTFKKSIYVFCLLIILTTSTKAQVGIGTTNPNASAQLDVSSTSKGFLPPRMIASQRAAISSPVAGLMVYQTDGIKGLYYYDGISWIFIITQSSLDLKAPLASPTFTGTVNGITSTMVGLGNVNNTTDANKPISTATQSALNLKAPLASPTFTGIVNGITSSMVGLGNVDNTTDANKPISTATQSALNLKAPLASPTFTGTVNGITSTMVGLGNVDNTTDANKPISTATQSALNLKAPLASPIFTGTPTLPTGTIGVTQSAGNNTTALATTEFVKSAVSVGSTTTHTIGESFGGGKVFYVSTDGLHGLIAETVDIVNTYWHDAFNKISERSNHSPEGSLFFDWRLPTRFELNQLWSNRLTAFPGLPNGGFASNLYWTSNEYYKQFEADPNNWAWYQSFTDGSREGAVKSVYSGRHVRAIRSF